MSEEKIEWKCTGVVRGNRCNYIISDLEMKSHRYDLGCHRCGCKFRDFTSVVVVCDKEKETESINAQSPTEVIDRIIQIINSIGLSADDNAAVKIALKEERKRYE